MEYTDFKGLKISRLGFGTMRLPLDSEGKIDYEEGQKMMDYALANGINYIDTAYMYHEGRAEVFTGKAIAKHPRDSFYLADKLPIWLCKTEEDVARIFEKQLSKCNVDYFDFYLLHNVDEECWPAIKELHAVDYLKQQIAAGRIGHLGASFHCDADLLREVLTLYGDDLEFIQLQINYFDWEYQDAEAIYKVAQEFNKPLVIMEPLRGGMLSNPMSEDACKILDEAAADATQGMAGDGHASYTAYALRFVDGLEGILTTLSGMSNLQQMKENIEIFNRPALSQGEHEAIDQAVKTLKNDILVPCTGCNYCFECPAGIKIPEIFKIYNEAAVKGFHWIWGSLSGQYNEIQPNAKACIGCGACESHCPQKIKIVSKLAEIDAKYAELEAAGE